MLAVALCFAPIAALCLLEWRAAARRRREVAFVWAWCRALWAKCNICDRDDAIGPHPWRHCFDLGCKRVDGLARPKHWPHRTREEALALTREAFRTGVI